jgi:hypothetical protein
MQSQKLDAKALPFSHTKKKKAEKAQGGALSTGRKSKSWITLILI